MGQIQEAKVITVEGLQGAGKTTLIQCLATDHPEMFAIVREISDPEGMMEATRRGDRTFFLRSDEEKIRSARQSTKPFCLSDRGHLSTVIYSRALTEFEGSDQSHVEEWYSRRILLGDGMLPDAYVLLDCDPQTSRSRRGLQGYIWDNFHALTFARNMYPHYMQTHESHIPVCTLNSAVMTTHELQREVLTFVSSLGRKN
jgi:thymidylate kinase